MFFYIVDAQFCFSDMLFFLGLVFSPSSWLDYLSFCCSLLSFLFVHLALKTMILFLLSFPCATVTSFTTRFFRVIISHQFLFLLHLSLYIKSILFCWELKNFQIVLMFCDMQQMENSSVLICSAGYVNRCFTSVTECHRYRMKCVQRLTVKLKFPIKDKVTYSNIDSRLIFNYCFLCLYALNPLRPK